MLLFLGEAARAKPYLEQAITLYDPKIHESLVFRYGGMDGNVQCLTHLAHALWILGYPDQALERSEEVLTFARGLSHPFSLAYALQYGARVHLYRGAIKGAQELTDALIAIAKEQGFPARLSDGTTLRGWVLAGRYCVILQESWGRISCTETRRNRWKWAIQIEGLLTK